MFLHIERTQERRSTVRFWIKVNLPWPGLMKTHDPTTKNFIINYQTSSLGHYYHRNNLKCLCAPKMVAGLATWHWDVQSSIGPFPLNIQEIISWSFHSQLVKTSVHNPLMNTYTHAYAYGHTYKDTNESNILHMTILPRTTYSFWICCFVTPRIVLAGQSLPTYECWLQQRIATDLGTEY